MRGGPSPGRLLEMGERIGPFVVVGVLGRGGMGHVYLACSWSGRPFAVKTILPDLAEDPEYRRRFAREAELAARVTGVFTAEVVDADPAAPVPWMATAYVPAPSLSELVRACGVLPPSAVRWLAAGVSEGLHAVHAAGLVHRDVKPSNILIAVDGPRLIDFGIAEAVDRTRTLTTLGTVAYIAPEQARGEPVTAAADMYSLGSTLVYAACGQPPYRGEHVFTVLNAVAHQRPDLTGLPPELSDLVEPCLRPEPADRPLPADVLARFSPIPDVLTRGTGAAPWLPGPHLAMVRDRMTAGLRGAPPPPARSGGTDVSPSGRPGVVPPPPRGGSATVPVTKAYEPVRDGPGGPPGATPPAGAPDRTADDAATRQPESPGPASPGPASPGPGSHGPRRPGPGWPDPPGPGPANDGLTRRHTTPLSYDFADIPARRDAAGRDGSGRDAAGRDGASVPVLPDDLHRRRLRAERDAAEGRHAEALAAYADIVDACARRFGPGDRLTLAVRHDHAFWLGGLGRADLALDRYADLVRDHLRYAGPDDPGTLAARHNHACCTGMAGDAAGAARLLAGVADDRARTLGPAHRATLTARRNLAHWTGHAGHPAEAVRGLEGLLADAERALGRNHPDTEDVRRTLALWRSRTGGAEAGR